MEDVAQEAINPNPSNQRISPYLAKVISPDAVPSLAPTFTPQGPGKFKERCAHGVVHSVLNEHIPAEISKVRIIRLIFIFFSSCLLLVHFSIL